jgi:hypothetical protein
VPLPYHLERLAEWAATTAQWLREGGLREGEEGERPLPERETEELFESFDSMARFLGGMAPAGQERLRKLDGLEGLRRMLTVRGMLPDWWYRLRDQVENGEL